MPFYTPFSFIKQEGAGFDPDAQAFITATGISGVEATAINTLVLDLKGYGIYSKFDAIYPFVGGTATTHKYNLINPADTDAAFRLLFSGGWTHNSNGITGNGTNTYADTYYNVSVLAPTNDFHMSIYSRTSTAANWYDIGAYTPAGGDTLVQARWGNGKGNVNFSTTYGTDFTNSDGTGFYVGNIDTVTKAYKNGSEVLSKSQTHTKPNLNLYIGASARTGGYDLPSGRNFAFSSIGLSLNATQNANFYTAVQAYQTTLGRQV